MLKKSRGLLSFPTNTKDLFRWIVTRIIASVGIGWVLGFFALLIASVMLFGFLLGDYKGNGTGTTDNSSNGVTLDASTIAENKMILTHYNEVSNSWQSGLTASQVNQIEQQQVDLSGAVLLGIGKMINDYDSTNAHEYYSYLKPTYTWQKYKNVTVTHHLETSDINGKAIKKCVVSQTQTPVTVLLTANTWDGTLTDSYKWVTTQTGVGCNITYTKTIELADSNRTYDWSRVWNLFTHIPTTSDGQSRFIQKNKTNQQTLAGLIATVDYGLSDPFVQEMVSSVLFPGGATLSLRGPVGAPSTNVIHNILRWKPYIDAAANKYQVPSVLIAGIMYQESGGREHDTNGNPLVSSAGAIGLMQVERTTAVGMDLNGQYIGANAFADLANSATNIEIGTMFISELYHQFGSDPSETESAYNAGPGAEDYALANGQKVAQNTQTITYVNNIQNTWIPALTKYFGK